MKIFKKITNKAFYNSGLFLNLKISDLEHASELVGIDKNTLKCILEKNNRDNSKNIEFNKLIQNICSEIKDQEFLLKMLSKMLLVKEYGQFTMSKNSMRGILKIGTLEYVLEASVLTNKIHFNVFGDKISLRGEFIKTNDGQDEHIIIKYVDKNICFFEKTVKKDNNEFDVCNITTIEDTNVYNLNYVQMLKFIKTKREINLSNKKTGEQILNGLDFIKNYTESIYYLRDGNYILKRNIKEYENDESIEDHFIAQNYYPKSKKLYIDNNYSWVDKEIYDLYQAGKCEIETLWQSRIESSQKKIGRK